MGDGLVMNVMMLMLMMNNGDDLVVVVVMVMTMMMTCDDLMMTAFRFHTQSKYHRAAETDHRSLS